MKVAAFALAGAAGAFILSGQAQADYSNVSIVDAGNPNAGETTYRLYANFTSPTDQLLAISGNVNINALQFSTNTSLINDGGAFAGLKQEDFAASPLTGLYDSYVTIGHSVFAGNDTNYSPGFLNNDGVTSVIGGSSWSSSDEGWFDSNPGTPAIGTSIMIAQFTVADKQDGSAGDISLQGTVDWQPAPGDLRHDGFAVTTLPAPGALALLGLAGLAGTRRRRG